MASTRWEERRDWLKRKLIDFRNYLASSLDALLDSYTKEANDTEDLAAPIQTNPLGSHAAGIPGVVLKALVMLILPVLKAYEYGRYKQNPNKYPKPTFSRKEIVYFTVDMILFGLAVAALATFGSLASAIIGTVAATVCFATGIYQFINFEIKLSEIKKKITAKEKEINTALEEGMDTDALTNQLDDLREEYANLKSSQYATFKRTLNTAFMASYVVSAGLMLAGVLLGPLGLPVMMASVALAATISVINMIAYCVDIIKRRLETKYDENPVKHSDSNLYKLLRGERDIDHPEFFKKEGIELKVISQNPAPPTPQQAEQTVNGHHSAIGSTDDAASLSSPRPGRRGTQNGM